MKNKCLRIGLFTDVYYPSISGVVVAVDTLRKALEQEGHKVFIITMNNDPKSHKYIKKKNCLMIPGIPTGIYDYSIRVLYPFKAVKMIEDLHLDIIHAHTEFGMGVFAKQMAKKFDIPLVHTFHTMYEDTMDYVTKGVFPKTSKRILKTYMKAYFSKTVKEIIVPTNKTKLFLTNRYHIKNNINIIPNGIDIEKFYLKKKDEKKVLELRKKYHIDDDAFIAAWIGRLGYEKSINILIEGFVDVVKKHKNAILLIVGGGPEEDKLKDIVDKYKINNNVIFTDKVSYDEVSYFYHLADVVCSASRFETQGLTLVEAFASSTPVVVINDKVFLDIVKNGYNGMIFKNKKEYASCINYLIENEKVVKTMKKNALDFSKNYSLKCFAAKIMYVYNKTINEYEKRKKEI